MKVIVQENTVEIWVANNTDEAVVEVALLTYQRTGKNVVIYRSGNRDLLETVQNLLVSNI